MAGIYMSNALEFDLQEDRQHLRLHYNADVEVETLDRRFLSGKLRDIGLDSLYMFTQNRRDDFLADGENVKVKVTMRRGQSKLTLDIDARVARLDEEGLALKFNHFLKWWPIFVMFPPTETN